MATKKAKTKANPARRRRIGPSPEPLSPKERALELARIKTLAKLAARALNRKEDFTIVADDGKANICIAVERGEYAEKGKIMIALAGPKMASRRITVHAQTFQEYFFETLATHFTAGYNRKQRTS